MTARLLLVALSVILAPSFASGHVVRAICRDGVPPPRVLCDINSCVRPVRCDAGNQCDGTCTFAIRSCGEVACSDHLVSVLVGHREKMTLATALGAKPTKFVLRCLPHPRGAPCPTTTTTTTVTTTTNPSGLPSCNTAADCEALANPCVPPFCDNGHCECTCARGSGSTCSPELADRCTSDADCRSPSFPQPANIFGCKFCADGLCHFPVTPCG